jgi:EmrB/QacA subfamily drug resistance transporter
MSDTTATPPVTSTGYTHRQIMLIMSGLMMGLLLAALDQTIVTTALTTISRDFHRLDLYSWVVTAYLLTSTASTPLYGKISDQFGRKTVFQIAVVIFLIGSVLSGLSQSMIQLILFRGVQGLGAGGLMTLAMAIVGDVIPPRERGRYQGYFGAVFGISSVVGPLIGGFLVDEASWRWVFYVNIPIGVATLVVINRVLHLEQRRRKAKVDVLGSVLIVSGVSLFLVGVQSAGSAARLTTAASVYGITGLLLVGVFIWWETRAAEPIVPLHLFRIRVVSVANVLAFCTATVMFGALIFLPQYFQRVRDISPTLSGLRLVPMLAGMLLTSISSGVLISRIGRYKMFVVAGTGIMTLGLLWMTTIQLDTGGWLLSAMLFVVGCGFGLFMQTLLLAVQNSITAEDMGAGTATVTFFRTLGGAIGAAVLGAVLIEQLKTTGAHYVRVYGPTVGPLQAFTHAMTTAFLYTVPVGVLAFVLSFLLRDVRLRTSLGGQEKEPAEAPKAAVVAVATNGRLDADGARASTGEPATPPVPGERAGPSQPGEPVRPTAVLEPPGF